MPTLSRPAPDQPVRTYRPSLPDLPTTTRPASRWPVLLYGSVVYVFFLATFLHALGFVNRLVVPKDIDTGSVVPLGEALTVNLGLLGLFAVQHMIMARRWFKARFARVLPVAAERSTFVLATCLILCALYVAWRPLPQVIWSVQDPVLATGLEILSLAGWGLVLVATFLIDHFDLFGLKQVLRHFRGRPHQDPAFRVRSLYRHTRHPLYLGFFIAFWSTGEMTLGRLVFAIATTVFVLIAVRLEERDLVHAHGEQYRAYRAQVPMILPSLVRRHAGQ